MIKQFTLGATTWTVEEVVEIDEGDSLGVCQHTRTNVEVAKNCLRNVVSVPCKELVVYHEVVHAIFGTLGYHDLNEDEKLVQGFAVLMQQFEQTKK